MTGFRVKKGGILSLIQDQGRFGYQHLGVTTGGPMDAMSANWANRLLDNSPDAPLLEITAGGLELESRTQTMVAVTGGDLNLTINDRPQAPWRSFWVKQGDRLKFGHPRHGFRAYLAVSDGFDIKPTLGSTSAVMRDHLGGLSGKGEKLKEGDELPCRHLSEEGISRQIPERYMPDFASDLVLQLIPGYQQELFSKEAWSDFWKSEYVISNDSNRMGARLEGHAIESPDQAMLSEGVCFGAVQVPNDGKPIVMLQDSQTLGGYPKLGAILPLDAFNLAQRQPGTPLCFRPIGLTTAQQQMRRYLRFFGL